MHLLCLLPLLALARASPSDSAVDALDASVAGGPAGAGALSCAALGASTRLSLVLSDLRYNASWVYSTPAHLATAQGLVGFTLLNNLLPAPIYCSASSTTEFSFFSGGFPYGCDVSKVPAAVGAKVAFTFDTAEGGTVAVAASWSCVDPRSHAL
jgi:hypothetical protein